MSRKSLTLNNGFMVEHKKNAIDGVCIATTYGNEKNFIVGFYKIESLITKILLWR